MMGCTPEIGYRHSVCIVYSVFLTTIIGKAFSHQVVVVERDAPEDDVEHQKYRQVDYFPSIVHPARILLISIIFK
jgi:hypothetical protein